MNPTILVTGEVPPLEAACPFNGREEGQGLGTGDEAVHAFITIS